MTEIVMARGETRLTSTDAERRELYAEAQNEAREQFPIPDEAATLTVLLDWLWQARRMSSPGFSRLSPPRPVREPRPRPEPL